MHKYLEISKIYFKTQLAWRVDVIFHMLFTISKIIFAYLLWGIIFANKTTIADFTFHQMMSYYIINSFLSQLELSEKISEELSTKIRNGGFSKYLVVPVNVEGYFAAMDIGILFFYLFFDFVAAIVWVFLFQIQFVITQNGFLLGCAILLFLLGSFFMMQLNYYLGLLTLKFQEISTFLMIKNNIISLISGSIIPLALFPDTVIQIMKLLPFYYVTYLPSMLLIGKSGEEAVKGIVIMILWCIFIQIVIVSTWRKYRKKYDGAGI